VPSRTRAPFRPALWLLLGAAALASSARGETRLLQLDPASTRITFTLPATLHTVEGSVPLLRGTIRFDPAGGPAEGEVVADARGATTGLSSRDARMHGEILESQRFPTIVLRPEHLDVSRRDAHSAEVELRGALEIHGSSHPVTLPARLTADGDHLTIESTFVVPFVSWGMEDPSNFLLRVDPQVTVQLHAEGTLGPPVPQGPAAGSTP
jgi:polyisoprenoid-binding protein YceI